jgi:hypothetical protein
VSARFLRRAAGIAAAAAALAYLHDPPWAARVTSGLRPWEENPPGTFFRWTTGRASFYIPANAKWIMLPMLAVYPGPGGAPVKVEVRVDDRFLATIELTDPLTWIRPELPIGGRPSRRSFRRIDLRVNRVVGESVFGVVTGQPTIW